MLKASLTDYSQCCNGISGPFAPSEAKLIIRNVVLIPSTFTSIRFVFPTAVYIYYQQTTNGVFTYCLDQ